MIFQSVYHVCARDKEPATVRPLLANRGVVHFRASEQRNRARRSSRTRPNPSISGTFPGPVRSLVPSAPTPRTAPRALTSTRCGWQCAVETSSPLTSPRKTFCSLPPHLSFPAIILVPYFFRVRGKGRLLCHPVLSLSLSLSFPRPAVISSRSRETSIPVHIVLPPPTSFCGFSLPSVAEL